MIGERLRAVRKAAALSQQSLADVVGVSKMAISKYERGLDVPGSAVLLRLATALRVRVEYFFRPTSVTLTSAQFRSETGTTLSAKCKTAVLNQVTEWLERYADAEAVVAVPPRFAPPSGLSHRAGSATSLERAACRLREAWHLGTGAIENLTEALEDRGVKVGQIDGPDSFEAVSCWLDGNAPVIVTRSGIPGDRQRFSLSHELYHLLVAPQDRAPDEEEAQRFAAAFLVPEQVARFELGVKRQALDLLELHLLKHKYGLSMQGWIHRAEDLAIIPKGTARRYLVGFRKEGWNRVEPGDEYPQERASRLPRLVIRALAEALVTESRAAELLGESLGKFQLKEAKEHGGFPVGVRS